MILQMDCCAKLSESVLSDQSGWSELSPAQTVFKRNSRAATIIMFNVLQ